jgi:ArsR family transcriptional regulator
VSTAQALVFAELLKALAEANRIRIVSLLAAAPAGDLTVCDLTDALELSQPTVSHHLKVLRGAGIVTCEKRGTWAHYGIVPEALQAISDVLNPHVRG